MSVQAKRSESTRAALVTAGRELFADRGFAAVGTEEIVGRAGVTRGALYHHFEDKRDLFRAVHEQVESELTQRIGVKLAEAGSADPATALIEGTRAFLDACTQPEVATIALSEAPGVLGWTEWRQVEERYGLGLVIAALGAAMEAGAVRPQPVRPLAHVLLAALSEAGLMIANAERPDEAREQVEAALVSLLDGLSAP